MSVFQTRDNGRGSAQSEQAGSTRGLWAWALLGGLSLGGLSVLGVSGCGSSDSGDDADSVPDATPEVEGHVKNIKDALFGNDGADPKIWNLGLVGSLETVVKDLCAEEATEATCPYSDKDFQRLEAGNGHFDALDPSVKAQVAAANAYFGGVVGVFDERGTAIGNLNEIHPPLGVHQLSLVKRETAAALNEARYGMLFWPKGGVVLEAFTTYGWASGCFSANTGGNAYSSSSCNGCCTGYTPCKSVSGGYRCTWQ